ncbi:hypothetical protein [Cellulomonas fengjieae]|uniref:Uncharacterized protein n=1 Tax=Cellulomonas fengjieae TaxID=2819978 RepID=A0ABS3SLJ2_9CELL|nr:hypothetical protein [Cellulomonas fengjieae]MBO3086590.1 hypothetical protein [Cellulomonas fengjieae]MBO3100583.1 hypothetical protein [Cellulomonas fengjieae]QVI66558.1 hypothetical protein KG102_02830 [Cellulomonas fengjieae]
MNDLAGPVALALVGLWVAYLVPHKLRHRQQLLESRADDRFSEALRVVAVSDRRIRQEAAAAECGPTASSTVGLLTPSRGLPVATGSATGGTTVDRPHGTQDRITADAARRAAQARAARAASVARRAAAARRRAVLAGILLAATAVGWAAVGFSPLVTWVAGAVPTVLLSTVLVLGRRAVVAGRAADAAWERKIADERRVASGPRTGAMRAVATATRPAATTQTTKPSTKQTKKQTTSVAAPAAEATPATPDEAPLEAPTAFVTGRAVHPSDASTEVFERIVADKGESGGPVRHASTGQVPVVRVEAAEPEASSDDEAWSPVPVPRPTYTMKASAPRREPAPLDNLEGSTAVRAEAEAPAGVDRAPLEAPVETTGSIDLNAVLAKRRVAGE